VCRGKRSESISQVNEAPETEMPPAGDSTSGGAGKPPEGSLSIGSSLSAILEDVSVNEVMDPTSNASPGPGEESCRTSVNSKHSGGSTQHEFHPIQGDTVADLGGWQPSQKEKRKADNTSAKPKTLPTPPSGGSKRSRRRGKEGGQPTAQIDEPGEGKPAVCGQRAVPILNTCGLSQAPGTNVGPASGAPTMEITVAGRRGVAKVEPSAAHKPACATSATRLPTAEGIHTDVTSDRRRLSSMATSQTTIAATLPAGPCMALGQSLLMSMRSGQSGTLQLLSRSDDTRPPVRVPSSRVPGAPPVQTPLPSRIPPASPQLPPPPQAIRHDCSKQESGMPL